MGFQWLFRLCGLSRVVSLYLCGLSVRSQSMVVARSICALSVASLMHSFPEKEMPQGCPYHKERKTQRKKQKE